MDKKHHVLKPRYDKEILFKAIEKSLDTGWTGDGAETTNFEKDWEEYTGYKQNIYVNSCTAGLHLAIMALKERYPEKKKVIVPDITFVSTASVVLQAELELVICKVDNSLCMSIHQLEGLINEEVLCIVYVGIGGNTENLSEIEEISGREGIDLVIDAAHMGEAEGKISTKNILEIKQPLYVIATKQLKILELQTQEWFRLMMKVIKRVFQDTDGWV